MSQFLVSPYRIWTEYVEGGEGLSYARVRLVPDMRYCPAYTIAQESPGGKWGTVDTGFVAKDGITPFYPFDTKEAAMAHLDKWLVNVREARILSQEEWDRLEVLQNEG